MSANDIFQKYFDIESNTSWGRPTDREVWPWWQFIKDKWVPRPIDLTVQANPDYELNQRKELVKEWMEAVQSFRDTYITRTSTLSPSEGASLREGLQTNGHHEFNNPSYLPTRYPLILTDPPASTPTSRAWSRLLFLTCFDSMGTFWHTPTPHYTPRTGSPPINPTTFPTFYLPYHTPEFSLFGLDITGKPYIYRDIYQFITPRDLQCGSKLVVEYASDGRIAREKRVVAYFSKNEDNNARGLGHGWFDLFEEVADFDENLEGVDVFGLRMGELAQRAAEVLGLEEVNDQKEWARWLEREEGGKT